MRSLASASLLTLTLTLTACGGGSAGSGSEGELRDAAAKYYVAFFEPDADTAYSMLTDRCKGITTKEELTSTINLAADVYGDVNVKINSVKIDGDKGRVEAESGIPALDEDDGDDSPQWKYEDGEWRSDACG